MKRIAIFASGRGTNTQNIIHHFHHNPDVKVECIMCNNPKAKVIAIAKEADVPYYLVSKPDLYETDHVLDLMKSSHIDLIVLAGFLWMIPKKILEAFPKKIINIHPALLPKHGGNHMFGRRVHEAVIANKEEETGITIHFVNEKYDEGEIIFQQSILVEKNDTADSLAVKVNELEHDWYPKLIEKLLEELE